MMMMIMMQPLPLLLLLMTIRAMILVVTSMVAPVMAAASRLSKGKMRRFTVLVPRRQAVLAR